MKCPKCGAANDEGVTHCFTCGGALQVTTVIKKGAVIATRYEIQETLGKGGMGTVYKAYDHILDEQVALKILRPDMVGEQDMARRFRLEIKLARKVRHKNVCGIHEYGEEGGLRFIAMEYIDGVDLRKVLTQRGALPMAEAFEISIAVALGLQAIHEAGIIHRDLKTPNIMVDSQGAVRLMDFGIAKQSGSNATLSGTAMGMIVGTPEYMSPEQGRGEKVDFRSDVYALGIVIYEIFTGNVPFRGDTPIATIFKHLQEPPPLTGPQASRIPRALVPVLAKALAKTPDERQPGVADLVEELKQSRTAALAEAPPPSATEVTVQGTVVLKAEPAPRPSGVPKTAVPTDVRTAVRTMTGEDIQREKQRALQEGQATIEADLARGAFDEAAAGLEKVRTRVGDPAALAELATRIAEARQRAEQEAQQKAEEARRRAEQEAQQRAEQERLRAEEERQRAEEAARQKRRIAAVREVEQLIGHGELDRAEKSLAEAVVAYGASTDLSALGTRIEKARKIAAEDQRRAEEDKRRREEAAAKERAVAEVMARAESLLGAKDFEKAHQAAEEATKLAPQNSGARALRTRVDEQWRQDAIQHATADVRGAMDRGAFDDAEARLKAAEDGLGKPTFKALRKDLEARRAAARKQEQQQATIIPGAAPGTAARPAAPGIGTGLKVAAAVSVVVIVLGGIGLVRLLRSHTATDDPSKPVETTAPTSEPVVPPAGTGSVVIDAVPWGEVVEIIDAKGQTHPVGEEHFTPLLLQLPPGDYTITVQNGSAAPSHLKVSVQPGKQVDVHAQFTPVDVDAYFGKAGFK
jgi:tRNA A-37 threonylcarbamoyl transferase component Bud32